MSKVANMAAGEGSRGISTVSPLVRKMVVSAKLEILWNWSMSKSANMAAGKGLRGVWRGQYGIPSYRK